MLSINFRDEGLSGIEEPGLMVNSDVKRKLIAAREDLVEKIDKMAKRRRLSLYGLVNELLEQAVRVDAMGLTLKEIVDQHGVLEAARKAGFTITIESLLYDVVERAFKSGRRVAKKWYETGQWYGKYYSARQPEDPLDAFKKAVAALTWNVSEFDIADEGGGKVTVRCVSPRFPLSYTELLSTFLEGTLDGLGYECIAKDVFMGVIKLTFKRGGEGG